MSWFRVVSPPPVIVIPAPIVGAMTTASRSIPTKSRFSASPPSTITSSYSPGYITIDQCSSGEARVAMTWATAGPIVVKFAYAVGFGSTTTVRSNVG
jgi:hypothetical protein